MVKTKRKSKLKKMTSTTHLSTHLSHHHSHSHSRSVVKMKDSQNKKKRLNVQKLRLGLDNTDYEKEFEFPAEAPGRVIVRLERLMGTDRIRITDLKYMDTLLSRLEDEEHELWKKRSRARRKAEYNRFRQLVIDGYTEPGPGMEDLINHPVFRVNRILNRLSKLDYSLHGPVLRMPPIDAVEPFEDDDTGEIFKSYSGHIRFARQLELMAKSSSVVTVRHNKSSISRSRHNSQSQSRQLRVTIADDGESGGEQDAKEEEARAQSAASIARKFVQLQTNGGAVSGGEDRRKSSVVSKKVSMKVRESSSKGVIKPKPSASEVSKSVFVGLKDIQRKYGVAPNVDLGAQWKPYRSEVVDLLYTDEDKGVLDLYQMGNDIVCMYEREQLTTDDYISAFKSFEDTDGEGEGNRASNEVTTDYWSELDETEAETEDEFEDEYEDEELEHYHHDYTTDDGEDDYDEEEDEEEDYNYDEDDKGYDASAE